MKPILTAVVYGFFAGFVTAAVLHIMRILEALIWGNVHNQDHILAFLIVMMGGLLVALFRHFDPKEDFNGQLLAIDKALPDSIGKATNLAFLGTASIAFGGAIGPEGGVIAVIGALSDFVSKRIGKNVQEQRLIRQVGIAGALGAIYRSPPGGASYADESREAPWPLLFLAGILGLVGLYAGTAIFPKGQGLLIPVPKPERDMVLSTLGLMVLPPFVGSLTAIVYLVTKYYGDLVLDKFSKDVRIRVIIGSFAFALVIAIWPEMRSNGQAQLTILSAHPEHYSAAALYLSALLKAIAMSLCLAAGWLGGPVMPLAFMGVCGGLAVSQFLPGVDPGLAAIAGAGASACVGMNKPLIALLVLLFMTTHLAPIAIVLGVGVGVVVNMFVPQALVKHAGHK